MIRVMMSWKGLSIPFRGKPLGERLRKKANSPFDDLLVDCSSMLATMSTEMVQIFRDLVAIVKRNAVAAQQANCARR